MKADRELDALIFSEVFGARRKDWPDGSKSWVLPDGRHKSYVPHYSIQIADAKTASDKAGRVVVFAPGASVRDGCYANRKKEWLVEIIPHGGTTDDAVWAYGETEKLARCLAALKVADMKRRRKMKTRHETRAMNKLKDRIRDLKAENEALEKRAFTYVSENGRELLVRMWNDEPWIFYKHPDGQWVSLEKIALLTGEDDETTE